MKSQKQTQNVVRQETCFLFLPSGVVVYVCFLYVAAYDIKKSVSTIFWLFSVGQSSFCSETQLFHLFSKNKTWGKGWSRSFEWWWWVKGFIYNKEQIDLNLRCWSEVILVRVMKMRDGFWWRTVTLTLCITVAQTPSAVWRSGAGKRSFVQLWI